MMMNVVKRNGESEVVSFDKVLNRLRALSDGLTAVNVFELAQKVCSRIYDGVSTCELDELAAHLCSSLIVEHPDYDIMASRIATSNHHKRTSPSFSETMWLLKENGLVNDRIYDVVLKNKEKLNSTIDYTRDYTYDYFGFKTLEKSYLLKVNGKPVERVQHMLMRVSLGIHGTDLKDALQTYDMMSRKLFIHATPTLFNAGTHREQNSSCFLVNLEEDSIDGIFNTLKDCALISKYAGGIGLHVHHVRAQGSRIKGTNGISTGIVPMLRVFNNTARYVNQGGKRNGSIAVFIEPWHADIEGFIELRKNHGAEEERARDLFYAMWIPDLFMRRVKEDGMWSLMCPDACPGLPDVYGAEFDRLYESYEAAGNYRKQIKAQELWFKILESQIETGVPYIGFKDHVNRKTNQSNVGTIKSSNLCMEIMQVSKPDEVAVCNLANLCLKNFVVSSSVSSLEGIEGDEKKKEKAFNFDGLYECTKVMVKNLNKIIDVNFYPIQKAETSNKKHRPIGIGVQGLADVFVQMRFPFDGPEAKALNVLIFETIYYAAMESSMELAKKHGPYSTFSGSPVSQGIFQFDLWNLKEGDLSGRYDWTALKERVIQHGVLNSLLLAPMPTASTSQIMSSNECFEPFTSNMYKRKTMAGEFILVNKYLVEDLIKLNLWTPSVREQIMLHDGSVQSIDAIPDDLKAIYKTVWEIKQRVLIDMAADRGPFICQSQSMNLFMESPDFKKLSSMHFYSWEKGLKTGIYYLRSKAKAKIQQFTLDPKMTKLANVSSLAPSDSIDEKKVENESNKEKEKEKRIVCDAEDGICLMCQ